VAIQYAHFRKHHETNISVVDIINVPPWIIKVSDFCFLATHQWLLLDIFLGSEHISQGQ